MTDAPLTSAEIRAAFHGAIPPIPVTLGYRLRLTGVLAGLVLLQLAYLLLVAAVVSLTVLYALAILGSGIRLNFLTILLYAGPPTAGIVATIFLLKPILIRPPAAPELLRLDPASQPVLFEFVQRLCRTLGAPIPSRICVDLRANASAAVDGWRGFFSGRLNLTIGLPLAMDFTLAQFAGVLAHEFGHFSQRAGLRSQYLVWTIQNWFQRVVYQRDRWDEWLDRQRDHGDWRVRVCAGLAAFAVSIGRKYLTLLMTVGSWFSAAFSRQMEFDADRYEAAIAGVQVFEQTSMRLPLLSAAESVAWQDVAKDWEVGCLPDNLATLVILRASHLEGEFAGELASATLTQQTGRWDTHPATSDRIASVRQAGDQGVLQVDGPATRLFSDLSGLGRRATLHHYTHFIGIPEGAARLVPNEQTVDNAIAARAHHDAIVQLLHAESAFCIQWFRIDDGATRVQGPVEVACDPAAYCQAVETNFLHFTALVFRQAGVKVKPDSFQLKDTDVDAVRSIERQSARTVLELQDEWRGATSDAARRMEAAGAARQDAWQSYAALCACQDHVLDIRRHQCAITIVRENGNLFSAAVCANLLAELEQQCLSHVDTIVEQTMHAPALVLFDPEVAETAGAQLAALRLSGMERVQAVLNRYDSLCIRALGILANQVVNIEKL